MAKKLAKLNTYHFEAMRLRLLGAKYQEIANELDKSQRTVKSWFCEDDLFKEEFEQLKDETIEQARAILINYAPNAAGNLIQLASAEEKGKGSKIMLDANIDILDRVGLKPVEKQSIEHTGKDGEPIEISARELLLSRIDSLRPRKDQDNE